MTRLALLLISCLSFMAAPASAGAAADAPGAGAVQGSGIAAARVLVAKGDLEGAEQVLLRALALSPSPERIYYELGCIHEQRGNYGKALAAFKEGIKIHEQGRRGKP